MKKPPYKPIVLVLGVANAGRSQMAEALLRTVAGDVFHVISAGLRPTAEIDPAVIAVMAEEGIDLGGQRPKHRDEFSAHSVDVVITLGDETGEPLVQYFPQAEFHHWKFVTQPAWDAPAEKKLAHLRGLRDEMHTVITAFVAGYRLRLSFAPPVVPAIQHSLPSPS